jgi:hypothetical protein
VSVPAIVPTNALEITRLGYPNGVLGKMEKAAGWRPFVHARYCLVTVFVAIVPIALIVPTMVGAPIAVVSAPAGFALGIQFMTGALGLTASLAMFCYGAVQPGLRLFDAFAALAMVIVGAQLRHAGE